MKRSIALLLLLGCSAGPRARDTKLGPNKIHYVTVGSGSRTIVFVHCWAGNHTFWREQVPVLSSKARLVLIDLPGHGESDKPEVPYTMDFFADAVLAVMRDAKVEKATLVGHSMGVPIICRVFQKAPEKVAGLVAVDGFLKKVVFPPEQVEQIIGPLRTENYREHAKKFVTSMFPTPGTEKVRDSVLEDMLRTPRHVMISAMEAMFGAVADWDIKQASVPVLVLNAKSPMWTPEYEQYARSLSPKTDYRTIDGVGHWLMLEKPAEFNAALVEMLRRHALIE